MNILTKKLTRKMGMDKPTYLAILRPVMRNMTCGIHGATVIDECKRED
jgi:hypothetical protein